MLSRTSIDFSPCQHISPTEKRDEATAPDTTPDMTVGKFNPGARRTTRRILSVGEANLVARVRAAISEPPALVQVRPFLRRARLHETSRHRRARQPDCARNRFRCCCSDREARRVTGPEAGKNWWRGRDLNPRPLGYEGNGWGDAEQLVATSTNETAALPPPLLLSVAVSCRQFPHNSRTVTPRPKRSVHPSDVVTRPQWMYS